MSPVRPVFNDGAILGAADLTALELLDRDRDARAARHLHTPGVASGLALKKRDRVPPPGVDVTVQPGFAIDGTGRELVLGTALPVSDDQFTGDIPNPVTQEASTVTVWYPVFIHGLDTAVEATNGMMGCQTATGPTRIDEDVEIEFGRPGDASVEQTVPPPDAGPGEGSWRVLVGFVQLDTANGHFVDVASTADGVTVPTAGVRAGLVAGQAGRVEIRPEPDATAGVPAVVVDADKGGSLTFGLHSGTGTLSPLMTVDSSGNLTVPGAVKSVQQAGTVRVISGTAFDGTVLPLPEGVEQTAVDSGAVQVSVFVTPRVPDVGAKRFMAAECRVDSDRRVQCWGTIVDFGGTPPSDVPASCDFLVLVSVPEGGS